MIALGRLVQGGTGRVHYAVAVRGAVKRGLGPVCGWWRGIVVNPDYWHKVDWTETSFDDLVHHRLPDRHLVNMRVAAQRMQVDRFCSAFASLFRNSPEATRDLEPYKLALFMAATLRDEEMVIEILDAVITKNIPPDLSLVKHLLNVRTRERTLLLESYGADVVRIVEASPVLLTAWIVSLTKAFNKAVNVPQSRLKPLFLELACLRKCLNHHFPYSGIMDMTMCMHLFSLYSAANQPQEALMAVYEAATCAVPPRSNAYSNLELGFIGAKNAYMLLRGLLQMKQDACAASVLNAMEETFKLHRQSYQGWTATVAAAPDRHWNAQSLRVSSVKLLLPEPGTNELKMLEMGMEMSIAESSRHLVAAYCRVFEYNACGLQLENGSAIDVVHWLKECRRYNHPLTQKFLNICTHKSSQKAYAAAFLQGDPRLPNIDEYTNDSAELKNFPKLKVENDASQLLVLQILDLCENAHFTPPLSMYEDLAKIASSNPGKVTGAYVNLKLLNHMLRSGTVPGTKSLCYVIESLLRGHNTYSMHLVMKSIISHYGVRYNSKLSKFLLRKLYKMRYAGNVVEILRSELTRIFSTRGANFELTSDVLVLFVRATCRVRRRSPALALIDKMYRRASVPTLNVPADVVNAEVFASIISSLCYHRSYKITNPEKDVSMDGMVAAALNYFYIMVEKFTPDADTVELLVTELQSRGEDGMMEVIWILKTIDGMEEFVYEPKVLYSMWCVFNNYLADDSADRLEDDSPRIIAEKGLRKVAKLTVEHIDDKMCEENAEIMELAQAARKLLYDYDAASDDAGDGDSQNDYGELTLKTREKNNLTF